MGVQLEPYKNHLFVKTVKRLENYLLHRGMNMHLYYFDIIFNLSAMGRKQNKKINLIYSLVDEMIQQREDELLNNVNTTKDGQKRTQKSAALHKCARLTENYSSRERQLASTTADFRQNLSISYFVLHPSTIATTAQVPSAAASVISPGRWAQVVLQYAPLIGGRASSRSPRIACGA
ncbi:PREDICTED: uncharacterized protein LOC105449087 [Wasmannia auropunctata]|uniref:uncharacterized protein LOC105449087 n=1 Tax=Wasmannia auropunctata TaxID=64793 RepID=UPI0005F03CD6|nr:PREDICTED: uncharacterized protein LOC105449087 [Wasmannia auropunctata]